MKILETTPQILRKMKYSSLQDAWSKWLNPTFEMELHFFFFFLILEKEGTEYQRVQELPVAPTSGSQAEGKGKEGVVVQSPPKQQVNLKMPLPHCMEVDH